MSVQSQAKSVPSNLPHHPVRFVTAASLFDGHDAAINIMRRVLQSRGVEVIHLGHDRSVDEVVSAAVQEDVDGVAVSSYQGGHMEYFTYLVDKLREAGRPEIGVFGGGGGTITDREIETLHSRGVRRLYSVDDGQKLGLVGMIDDMIERARRQDPIDYAGLAKGFSKANPAAVARSLTALELAHENADKERITSFSEAIQELETKTAPVIGITGVGGAGKSSLTDELVRRALSAFPDAQIAVLSVDPSRRRTGGALLGDRIRMNCAGNPRVFIRSMATRMAHAAVPATVRDALNGLKRAGFDLVLLETAGIGQSGSEVVDLCDYSLYVMTPEFGAPSQLEKIDMLDFADVVAINKADKRGAEDARKYVAKQMQRNRGAFQTPAEDMPVYCCIASRFGNAGVDALFAHMMNALETRGLGTFSVPPPPERAPSLASVVPPARVRYLSEIADTIRAYKAHAETAKACASELDGLQRTIGLLGGEVPAPGAPARAGIHNDDPTLTAIRKLYNEKLESLTDEHRSLLSNWPALTDSYETASQEYIVRNRSIKVDNYYTTLSGTAVPKVALPNSDDWGEHLKWALLENTPGRFPYTAGVFPFKRTGEDPTRMFAGEGCPERTNHRFHYLSRGQTAARLSTAFDSVTLYGRDPATRPDIYGKVGNSGVSIATLDDAKRLYSGFDLSASTTSVSMTINGPAPIILAMFLNTAIDQAVEKRLRSAGRWQEVESIRAKSHLAAPRYREDLPPGHDGSGLGLLGLSGDDVLTPEEYAEVKAETLARVRGTVQADILKEDQAQNTCIFSTEFALKMMGDIQSYFLDNEVRNFYSVSISGYHIAEAGANPITQLAFTLANGFTFVEYYRSRGMDPDGFARNLSFFFSNGIDAEYAVIGRVARRIWSVAMRNLYGAGPRSQMLKYHIQTSGRSLHAQEIDFNDIRTTLQALYAIADNCNSLHTNAFDEAITTPTEASVRRALAIQLIINRELGLAKNENPLQGSYFIDALTNLVEEAVLEEFDRLTDRGGVLGAMEMMYQRGRIQEESILYETKKHNGDLPIVGVNTFLPEVPSEGVVEVDLIRATEEEKSRQIEGVVDYRERHSVRGEQALAHLKTVAIAGENVFEALMETVKYCSLGQITDALFEVGGQYRRNV